MSAFPNNSSNPNNVDIFLLETLMERMQLRAPNNPLTSESLEDFLYRDFTDDDEEEDDDEFHQYEGTREELMNEEWKLEKEIVKTILSGKGDSLKPNSGQAVSIRDHSICVGCTPEDNGASMVWEWHGHIMAYDEKFGYSPEYIYGSYFQRVRPRMEAAPLPKEEEEEIERVNQGLKELIDVTKDDSAAAPRILHRNVNAASTRF